MKFIRTIALIGFLVAAATACNSEADTLANDDTTEFEVVGESIDAPAPSAAAKAPKPMVTFAPVTKASRIETIYIDAVRDNTTSYGGASDADILKVGYQVCETIDAVDGDVLEVVLGAIEGMDGTEAMDAGFTIGAAVQAFCPEYTDATLEAAELMMEYGG